MYAPKYEHDKTTDDAGLRGSIILYVMDLGYDFEGELGLIDTIEKNNIDLSKYDRLPYYSKDINEWREHALESQARLKELEQKFNEVIKSGNVKLIEM